MPTKPVTYRLEESLLQRIEKAVEVLKAENPYGTISKNSVVAGILEEGVQKILKEESPMKETKTFETLLEATEETQKTYNHRKEVKFMKKLDIFNGEHRDITVITDYGTFHIPAGCSRMVEIDEDAIFNQPEFYVEEQGDWYIKTKDCHTLCNAEIYNKDVD